MYVCVYISQFCYVGCGDHRQLEACPGVSILAIGKYISVSTWLNIFQPPSESLILLSFSLSLQPHHLSIWGSIGLWFLFVLAYSHFFPRFPIAEVMVGIDIALYSSFVFYGISVLAPSVAMLPDVFKTV